MDTAMWRPLGSTKCVLRGCKDALASDQFYISYTRLLVGEINGLPMVVWTKLSLYCLPGRERLLSQGSGPQGSQSKREGRTPHQARFWGQVSGRAIGKSVSSSSWFDAFTEPSGHRSRMSCVNMSSVNPSRPGVMQQARPHVHAPRLGRLWF